LGFPSSWPAIARCFWLEHMEAYALNSTFPITAFTRTWPASCTAIRRSRLFSMKQPI
jgi:hypothetical protein